MLDVLNDPRRRQEFTTTLDAIAKSLPAAASPAATPEAETAPKPLSIPLAPNSLGAELVVGASGYLSRLGEQLRHLVQALQSVPSVWHWVQTMATDPLSQALLLDIAWRLAVTIGAGLAVEWILRLLLRRPAAMVLARRRRIAARAEPAEPPSKLENNSDVDDAIARAEQSKIEANTPRSRRNRLRWLTPLRRLPIAGLHLLFDLLPVLGFIVITHGIAGSQIGSVYLTRLVLLAVIDAYAAIRILIAIGATIFAPGNAPRRLVPVDNPTAAAGLFWVRWITLVGIIGYAAAEVGLLLGLSTITHDAMLKTDVLVIYGMLVHLILRYRRPVADFIRAEPTPSGSGSWVSQGVMGRLRRWLARTWHIAASIYLIALWLVWAVDIPSGFSQLLHFFILTTIVLVLAQVILAISQGVLDRAIDPLTPANLHKPGRAERLRIYQPMLQSLLRLALLFLVLLALGQIYGIGIFDWLTTALLGQRVLSALAIIVMTLVVAVVIWESVNGGIQRHLGKLAKEGQTAKSARLRTLLPMLRTTLFGAILVVVTMMVLSEIGVNIAPLLASAGVLGIAIGFGSQKLVQDIITGLFLLLENTMQVGDIVTLGGLTGTVEHLSVRTIRLRSEDGSVYVIPFSAVTTVTNMTRDFSRAVIEAQVAYKEDYDQVVRVLRQIVRDMRIEPRWESEIRDDLEVLGLQRLTDASVIIKCRIRCGPFGRWAVGREFNRRMKMAFDAEGIEIPSTLPKTMLVAVPATPTPLSGAPTGPAPTSPVPTSPVPTGARSALPGAAG